MLLSLPFHYGDLAWPQKDEKWLCMGVSSLNVQWRDAVTCVQPFRPFYLSLQKAGFQVVLHFSDEQNADGALLLLGKFKKRNEADLITLMQRTKVGATIVVAGDKNCGGDSFYKKFKSQVDIINHYSKHHGRIFYFQRPDNIQALVDEFALSNENIDGFETAPGTFSHGRIDIGSALLVESFQDRIYGKVADFGAGWGYLSAHAVQEGQKLISVDLYEADYDALSCARKNLQLLQDQCEINYYWHDLLSEPVTGIYDTVISNPPFHAGRKADPMIGQKFIEVASKRLKKGGRFLMVANQNLPYEATLNQCFYRVTKLDEKDGFKIFEAIKK